MSKGLKMRKLYLLKKKKMEELLRQSDWNEELLRRSDRNEELLRRSALGGDFDRDDIADQIRKRRKKNPNDWMSRSGKRNIKKLEREEKALWGVCNYWYECISTVKVITIQWSKICVIYCVKFRGWASLPIYIIALLSY